MKKGFETFRNYEMGLGLAPVTFTETDHRPLSAATVYEYKSGEFAKFDEVDLKAKWPEQWEKEWLGW